LQQSSAGGVDFERYLKNMYKKISSVLIVISLLSCNPANRIFNKVHPHYSTYNYYQSDSSGTSLMQTIAYNVKGCIDEEYFYRLEINLKNCPLKEKINILNSDCLYASYNLQSVWFYNDKYEMRGWIKIRSVEDSTIVIRENIKIKDFKFQETLNFVGRRKFISLEKLKKKNRK
jgi:hypothetical protein